MYISGAHCPASTTELASPAVESWKQSLFALFFFFQTQIRFNLV
jgi:hypothetical protein